MKESSLQSGELSIGFARTLTEHMLRSRFPGRSVTIVPADTAGRTGRANRNGVGYDYVHSAADDHRRLDCGEIHPGTTSTAS
ncbi:hypothetical protein AB0N07_07255 [Streptomyces sp. NPDC051172]|uniref:hypothetical protein n=1 Tax=Streptomyces sp. NPDC051172 TaxID=3155796 RepID=UPI00343824C4